MTTENTEKAFMLCDAHMFAMPAHLLTAANLDTLRSNGVTPTEHTTMHVEGFEVDAYIFNGEHLPSDMQIFEHVESIMKNIGLTTRQSNIYKAVHKDKQIPCVSGPGTVLFTTEETMDLKKETHRDYCAYSQAATSELLPVLEKFASLCGKDVFLHVNMDLTGELDDGQSVEPVAPTIKTEESDIHIFIGLNPPGDADDTELRFVNRMFGMQLHEDHRRSPRCGHPARGRGITVYDDVDEACTQVIGNIFYFLPSFIPQFYEETPKIFDTLLTHTWNAYCSDETAYTSADTGDVQNLLSEWFEDGANRARKAIKDTETEIEKLNEKIVKLTRRKRNLVQGLKGYTDDAWINARDSLSDMYTRIEEIPEVRAIEVHDKGLHVITHPIIIEHNDVQRLIAQEYTIRVNERGTVDIWTDTPQHPKAVPHPHIGIYGNICFGNVGAAIAEAGSEHRYADLIQYVITWLTRGYTPELAEYPIEEWPTYTEKTE